MYNSNNNGNYGRNDDSNSYHGRDEKYRNGYGRYPDDMNNVDDYYDTNDYVDDYYNENGSEGSYELSNPYDNDFNQGNNFSDDGFTDNAFLDDNFSDDAFMDNNFSDDGFSNDSYQSNNYQDNGYQDDSYYNQENEGYGLSVINNDNGMQEKFINPFEDNSGYGMDIGENDAIGLENDAYGDNQYGDDMYASNYNDGYNNEYDNDHHQGNIYNPFFNRMDNYASEDFANEDFDNFIPNENTYDSDIDVTVVKPKSSNSMFGYIMTLALVILVGFLCGRLVNSFFYDFWNKHISNDNSMILEVAKMIGLVFLAWLCSKVHVLIHTLGHFIGGKISSYELVSIRLFRWVFVKDGDTLSRKKCDISSMMGECVMMPPEGDGVNYPFLLYKLGGIILNLICSLIALVLYMEVGALHSYPFNMISVIFALVGAVTIFYNGIPLIVNGQPNDGYIVVQMLTSEGARRAVHVRLLVSGFLARGGRYTDVPPEQFIINEKEEYSGHIAVQVKMLEYKRYMEDMDFVAAANCLNSVDSYYRKLPKINQCDITCEKIFLELIGGNSPEKIKEFMDQSIKRYLEDTQKTMSTARLMFTYQACFKNNMNAAAKYYSLLKNNAKSEPLKGEAEFEMMLAEYVNERFCENAFE